MGDRNGAMALAFGIAAALLQRTRTGEGSVVDVSLLATAMWTLSSDVLAALQGDDPRAHAGRLMVNPLVGSYRTRDGRHIQLVFLEADRYWAAVLPAGRPRRPGRRSPLRRPRRPAGQHARRASPCSRPSSPGGPSPSGRQLLARARRAVGAGAERGGAADRPAGGRQRLHRRRRHRRRAGATALPAVPVQFDERPPTAAPRARARRAHRGGARRARATRGTRSPR